MVFLFFASILVLKGPFKNYVILLGGGGSHQKDHKGGSPTDHRGSRSQGRGGHAKELTKLKVLIKDITTPRISYQWVFQEVISSETNIDFIGVTPKKICIFWKVVLQPI